MLFYLEGSIFCLSAYFLGSIPFGLVVSWLFGAQDPRQGGSGNIGFSNVLGLSGSKIAILTLIGDLGKGWLVGGIAAIFFYDNIWGLLGLLAVTLGHIFPVFLKFHGGKGVATSLGGILGYHFDLGIILVTIWLIIVAVSKYASAGALIAFIFFPIISWIMEPKIAFLVFSVLLSAIIMMKHKENIKRLIRGRESQIGSHR